MAHRIPMTEKQYSKIIINIPDIRIRINIINKAWSTQQKLKEKNPNYQNSPYLQIVTSQRPPYLQNENSTWLQVVEMYKNKNKKEFVPNPKKKISQKFCQLELSFW